MAGWAIGGEGCVGEGKVWGGWVGGQVGGWAGGGGDGVVSPFSPSKQGGAVVGATHSKHFLCEGPKYENCNQNIVRRT